MGNTLCGFPMLLTILLYTNEWRQNMKLSSNEISELLSIDATTFFYNICDSIKHDFSDYEAYYCLSKYYKSNINKEYLCLEMAAYYCTDEHDLDTITSRMSYLSTCKEFHVKNVSIVILSYNNMTITKDCIQSIKDTCPASSYEIVVVDNASTDGVTDWLLSLDYIKLRCNTDNAGFPVGCNQGVEISNTENDIFFLNNDTIMMPGSLFYLRMGLYESDDIGATGSTSNSVGSFQQIEEQYDNIDSYIDYSLRNNIPSLNPYTKHTRLVGFALLVKRTVLDITGAFDPIFTPGNFEDDDLCFKIIMSGHKLLLCHNSFIFHYGSMGFRKKEGSEKNATTAYNELMLRNIGFIDKKWNIRLLHSEILYQNFAAELNEDIDSDFSLLEIGTHFGQNLAAIHHMYPNSNLVGIEDNKTCAQLSDSMFPTLNIDFNYTDPDLPKHSFDYVVLNNTICETTNPDNIINKAYRYLKPSGVLIVMAPNILHFSALAQLLSGHMEYKNSGIIDKAYVRFYTLQSIYDLLTSNDFTPIYIGGYPESKDIPPESISFMNSLGSIPGVVGSDIMSIKEYVIKAKKQHRKDDCYEK